MQVHGIRLSHPFCLHTRLIRGIGMIKTEASLSGISALECCLVLDIDKDADIVTVFNNSTNLQMHTR